MTTRTIPAGGSSPAATRASTGVATILTIEKDHQGELARPTEERASYRLDELTADDIKDPKPFNPEIEFNNPDFLNQGRKPKTLKPVPSGEKKG